MNQNGMKYDAFISYRHISPDSDIAKLLVKLLEGFQLPKVLHFQYKKIQRVFRDQEELPTSTNLSMNIQEALSHSYSLIVVCSRNTPESIWINREVRTFIRLGRQNQIYVIWIEGSKEEAFPKSLLELPNQEIYHIIDIRGKDYADTTRKLRKEQVRICSELIGCELKILETACKKRNMVNRGVLTFSLLAIIGLIITSYQFYLSLAYGGNNMGSYNVASVNIVDMLDEYYTNIELSTFLYYDDLFPITGSSEALKTMLETNRNDLVSLENYYPSIEEYSMEENYGLFNNVLIDVLSGDLAALSGDYPLAKEFYLLSIEKYADVNFIYLRFDESEALMYSYKKCGDTYFQLKEYNLARSYYNSAIMLSDQSENMSFTIDEFYEGYKLRAKCYIKLVECYQKEKDTIKALQMYHKAKYYLDFVKKQFTYDYEIEEFDYYEECLDKLMK